MVYELLGKTKDKIMEEGILSFLSLASSKLYMVCKRAYVRGFKYETVNKSCRTIWVDPKEINYYQLGNNHTDYNFWEERNSLSVHELEKGMFTKDIYMGTVMPGEWDLYRKPYHFDRVYRWIKNHFKEDIYWENTEFYQKYFLLCRLQDPPWSPDERYQLRKYLYNSIKDNGYKQRSRLSELTSQLPEYYKKRFSKNPVDEVGVNIGRNGELIFNNDNHHRLAIANVLDIDKIPVTVVVRHKQWQDTRKNLQNNGLSGTHKEGLRNHPDLQDIFD